MKLRELFGLSENDRQLSVEAIKAIFDLEIVEEEYYNKWLIFRDDELLADFIDAYDVSKEDALDYEHFAIYFQEDDNNTRIVISHDFINNEGEKDAEMYHYFIRRFGMELQNVLVFYQAHNVFSQQLSLLTPKSETQNIESLGWFNFVSTILVAVNHLYEFDNQIFDMVEGAQISYPDIISQEPEMKYIVFGGIEYTVVNLKEGFEFLKGIKSVNEPDKELYTINNLFFESIEQDTYFLVVEEDVEVEELELLDFIEEYDIFILGYIFLGELIVTNSLFCEDLNFSPSLIVKGNLTVKNAYLSGNTHYIGGNVYGDLIYAKNKLGELHVNGYLDTSCIIAQDMACYIRSILTKVILTDDSIFGMDRVLDNDGKTHEVLNVYPTTFSVADALIDDIKEDNEGVNRLPDDNDIVEAFNEGKSVVKMSVNKVYLDFYMSISDRFNTIFNELLDGKGKASLKLKDGDSGMFFYSTFLNDNKKYREIGRKNSLLHYQSRILHEVDSDRYIALLEYYQDDDVVLKTVFESELTDRYSSTYAVLHAFNIAEDKFKREKGFL